MDRNIIAYDHHYADQEAAAAVACYSAAAHHGLSNMQADACDEFDRGCPTCPFSPQTAQPVPQAPNSPADFGAWLRQRITTDEKEEQKRQDLKVSASNLDAGNFIFLSGEVNFLRADSNDRRYFVINPNEIKGM